MKNNKNNLNNIMFIIPYVSYENAETQKVKILKANQKKLVFIDELIKSLGKFILVLLLI